MRRFLEIVVHNWPLKLAAIALATLLYGGLVLSQDAQDFSEQVAIRKPPVPAGLYLLEDPPPVTNIRYFAPAGTDRPSSDTFNATIDLSGITQGGEYSVRVLVTSVNPQIRVLDVTPEFVSVQLDPLIHKIVPVEIERGEIPDGLEIGAELASPSTVTVSGPKSIVDQVTAARADVVIQPSGIDVDRDVALVPVDEVGNPRSPADVSPTTARISIRVFSEPDSRTLPISASITGTPAAGYEIEAIRIEPASALVEGDVDPLSAIARLDTEPIQIDGLAEDTTFETALALPEGIEAVDPVPIRVTVSLRAVSESRSYSVGLRLIGTQTGLEYTVDAASVLLAIGGDPGALQTFSTGTLLGTLDVTGFGPGTYDVTVAADLPSGVTLVAASPATIPVTIVDPAASSPSPTSSATP